MMTDTGTLQYKAPEVWQSLGYGKKCDVWSVGIICYEMLTGNHPFPNYIDIISKNELEEFDFDLKSIDFSVENFDYSHLAKDFILRCLKQDPDKRLSVQKALKHPWFQVNYLINE